MLRTIIVVALCLILLTASAERNLKPDEVWVCVRWTWSGDVFNRKVVCLERKIQDCSNRLHKSLCMAEGSTK